MDMASGHSVCMSQATNDYAEPSSPVSSLNSSTTSTTSFFDEPGITKIIWSDEEDEADEKRKPGNHVDDAVKEFLEGDDEDFFFNEPLEKRQKND